MSMSTGNSGLPKIDRRRFIKTAGGMALAGLAATVPALTSIEAPQTTERPKSRVAVFYDPTFTGEDGGAISRETLAEALRDYECIFLTADEIVTKLAAPSFDLFVTPYGSAFPKNAFGVIIRYLSDGGSWMNLGGVPLAVPAVKEGTAWRHEIRQTEYQARLGITATFPIRSESKLSYRDSGEFDGLDGLAAEFSVGQIFALYLRFTGTKDYPSEDGSAGPRDAVVHTLVFGLDPEGTKVGAPCVVIDRLLGEFAGGRWVLINTSGNVSAKGIRRLAEFALQGAAALTVRSSFACYREGEMPSFTIDLRRPGGRLPETVDGECRLDIFDTSRRTIARLTTRLSGGASSWLGYADLATTRRTPLAPGLYKVVASQKMKIPSSGAAYRLQHTSGFWVYDRHLIEGGSALTCGPSYFERQGKPFPVTGTTYMTSDVHRKFLLEPNPAVWDTDFGEMKKAGVNMVRTGIWTAWKNVMLDAGVPNEGALRALDAFLLTARKYDIPVLFTFFAFLPDRWGGANAYLDPRSIDAQRQFIAAVAQRYPRVDDLLWDFINEPSFCSPDHLWSCRPNYDLFERKAWKEWLKRRTPASSENELTSILQERYRCLAEEAMDLPTLEDFEDVNIIGDRRPVKTIDYRLFAQDEFGEWVKKMKDAVRGNGNPRQLTTVGQDEGGTSDSPSPQFFGSAVDFTSIHNWWLNDDLVWDNVMTKVPGKPDLIEETGVMYYENVDGSPWRTEEEAGNLLERKMAIALGAGGAGFIEWVWNTNPYMASDNEAAIGFLRADGTAKPELAPFLSFTRFFAAHRHLMTGRKDEEVTMVIPHAGMFSVRSAVEAATKRCVRAMHYHCSVAMNGVSEYRLASSIPATRLFIVPSPQIFSRDAWAALLDKARQGATILFSGPMDFDEHWLPVQRVSSLGTSAGIGPVAEAEHLSIGGVDFRLDYRGEKIQRLQKAIVAGGSPSVVEMEVGKGRFVWSPLPVENSDSFDPTVALYRHALDRAGVTPVFTAEAKDPGILLRPTIFDTVVLYAIVSECSTPMGIKFTHMETGTTIETRIPAQRASLLLIDRKSGKILARL